MRAIDADVIVDTIVESTSIELYPSEWGEIEKAIDNIPTLDTTDKACWRKSNPFTDTYECSKCGYNIISEELQTPFCPWCGRLMLEENGCDYQGFVKTTYGFTVYEALILTEFMGKIVDFGGCAIEITDSNRDTIYGTSVIDIYAENDTVCIHTSINEEEYINRKVGNQ